MNKFLKFCLHSSIHLLGFVVLSSDGISIIIIMISSNRFVEFVLLKKKNKKTKKTNDPSIKMNKIFINVKRHKFLSVNDLKIQC